MSDTLESLRLPELQALYADVVGEATRSPNRAYLLRRIREAREAADEAALAAEREAANAANAVAEQAHAAAEAAVLAAASAEESALDISGGSAPADASAQLPPRKALMKMPVERLRDLYLGVVGRPSGSDNVAYVEPAVMWS